MRVTLAFYKGRKEENPATHWADRIVCWWTGSRFSHVELVAAIRYGDAMFSYSASPREGRVRGKLIDISTGHWEFADVAGDWDAATEWFIEHQGESYDWLGVLGFVLPLRLGFPGRWFCSEAVAASLGLHDPGSLSPQGLLERLAMMSASARRLLCTTSEKQDRSNVRDSM